MAFSGEEMGLWGSEFFAANSMIPLNRVSAVVNLDVLSGKDLNKITVTGGNQLSSSMDSIIKNPIFHL